MLPSVVRECAMERAMERHSWRSSPPPLPLTNLNPSSHQQSPRPYAAPEPSPTSSGLPSSSTRSSTDQGHLQIASLRSTLLPSQKAILAMSRAQYIASLDAAAKASRQGRNEGVVDGVLVGVCIFRLDGRTLQPAVLLLRRSPRWWRKQERDRETREIDTLGHEGEAVAGDWELPGGRVEEEDFCISSALERLVREKTGLRVTRIMEMLREIRGFNTAEVKVFRDLNFDEKKGRGTGQGDKRRNMVGGGSFTKVDLGPGIPVMSTERRKAIEGREVFHESGFKALGINKLRLSTSSGDSSSNGQLTRSVTPPPPPPPKDNVSYGYREQPPNRHHNNGREYGYHSREPSHDNEDEYHDLSLKPAPLALPSRSPRRPRPIVALPMPGEEEHRLSPLPSPSPPPPPPPIPRRHMQRVPSTTPEPRSPAPRPRPFPDWPSTQPQPQPQSQSQAQPPRPRPLPLPDWPIIIQPQPQQRSPNKPQQRKEYVQLNFAVLVDEDPADEPVPGFLLGNLALDESEAEEQKGGKERGDDGDTDRGRGRGRERGRENGEGVIYEHDALEWATCARVEVLPMSEDLRRVVFQGLDWMGRLTGGFF
ncbi:hypothetical protein GGR50DRAFT_344230 [Xylaria sp. CBS 124048]|nr:hypothetical protein GGR50DRAFT_344230 [Xylaria sp. CBS 124048]